MQVKVIISHSCSSSLKSGISIWKTKTFNIAKLKRKPIKDINMLIQEAPKGSIFVLRNGFEQVLYNIEDMQYTNELHIGHLCHAVRLHFKKKPQDYGSRWINYLNSDYEVSKAFIFMRDEINKLPNDYEKLLKALEH